MERWAIHIDIEGFGATYEKRRIVGSRLDMGQLSYKKLDLLILIGYHK